MNVPRILSVFAEHKVDAILIGGMNFLLRHKPLLTFDVDLWVRDTDANLALTARALLDLEAQWGRTEAEWKPTTLEHGWLRQQSVYCLTTPDGAVDVFRTVTGLEDYEQCRARSQELTTAEGIPYRSLSDADMLACQLALPESERSLDRTAYLLRLLEKRDE